MTGTCFFTFLFLLSFLCFIKGNTKGKLCYLLKNVKVRFQREEKKQTRYCLDREGRALEGWPETRTSVVGGAGAVNSPDLSNRPQESPGPALSFGSLKGVETPPGASRGERGHPKPAAGMGGGAQLTKAPFTAPHSLDLVWNHLHGPLHPAIGTVHSERAPCPPHRSLLRPALRFPSPEPQQVFVNSAESVLKF